MYNNTTTNSKSGKSRGWSSLEGTQSLRMYCPACDKRRSGACNHKILPNIANFKGNSK